MSGSLDITPKTVVVNVNSHVIRANAVAAKKGVSEFSPPIRVQHGKSGKPVYANEVAVLDEAGREVARFIYDPQGQLVACGARLVLVAHHGARAIS